MPIERELFGGRADLGVGLGTERRRAMYLCTPDPDVILSEWVGHDMHVMTHVGKGVGHFPNTRGRTVIGRKGASRNHGD